MEPTKEQLREWWEDKERVWQKSLELAGPRISGGSRGFCARGGRGGPFCLHTQDHGAGLFGEEVIATTWGYMHVECAVQSLRELESVGWTYSGPTFEPEPEPVTTPAVEEPEAPEPVMIETDELTASGIRIEGAQLEEVLTTGTQAEFLTLLNQFTGQPMFAMSRETGGLRMGHKTYRYFLWKVVE